MLLEVHYNNPNHVKDIVDVSGIQFFYSNQRREFEVGVLEIGNIYTSDMVIPPRQKMFSWPGICSSECTKVVSALFTRNWSYTYELRKDCYAKHQLTKLEPISIEYRYHQL